MPTKEDLKYFQAMPLDIKVAMTRTRIREWVNAFGESGVYVSFSGGKDSTVLLHLVRELYPDVPAVFVNTGLEYPEIQAFVKTFDNVTILKPAMRFDKVIQTYGYPMVSKDVSRTVREAQSYIRKSDKDKPVEYWIEHNDYPTLGIANLLGATKYKTHEIGKYYDFSRYRDLVNVDFMISEKCCDVMKKNPIKKSLQGVAGITAQMAEESRIRENNWIKYGCNAFEAKRAISNPMSFWTEQDVLKFIHDNNIKVASVYGEIIMNDGQMTFDGCDECCEECKYSATGLKRTGCIFCGFGAHRDKISRFKRLKETHPKQYNYCIGGVNMTLTGFGSRTTAA